MKSTRAGAAETIPYRLSPSRHYQNQRDTPLSENYTESPTTTHTNKVCKLPCEVYSRCVGYLRPVQQWNKGKQAEYKARRVFKLTDAQIEEMVRRNHGDF